MKLLSILTLMLVLFLTFSCKLIRTDISKYNNGRIMYYSRYDYDYHYYYFDFEKEKFIYSMFQRVRTDKSDNMQISEGELRKVSKNTYIIESIMRTDITNPYVDYIIFNDTVVFHSPKKAKVLKSTKEKIKLLQSDSFVNPYRGMYTKNTYNIEFPR